MMEKKEQQLENIVSTKKSNWQERTQRRRANPAAYNRALEIALLVMDIMEEKGWNQTKLAEAMNISRQAVSKISKGNRPLNMATIDKLEAVLGRPLLVVPTFKVVVAKEAITTKLITMRPIHMRNVVSSQPSIRTLASVYSGRVLHKANNQNQYSFGLTHTNHG